MIKTTVTPNPQPRRTTGEIAQQPNAPKLNKSPTPMHVARMWPPSTGVGPTSSNTESNGGSLLQGPRRDVAWPPTIRGYVSPRVQEDFARAVQTLSAQSYKKSPSSKRWCNNAPQQMHRNGHTTNATRLQHTTWTNAGNAATLRGDGSAAECFKNAILENLPD